MSKKTMAGREVLEEALRRSCSACYDQFPRYEGEIDPGERYEEYLNALIRRSKNPFPRYFNTVGKRAAGIAAALLIAFGCSMTVSAVRVPVVSFCANTYEKFVEIFFNAADVEKAPDKIETVYTLGSVPEGYELEKEYVTEQNAFLVWKNANGGSIEFEQNILDGRLSIDNEENEFFYYDVDGTQILFKEKYGMKTYFWNTNEYQFCLHIIDTDISTEDGIELIRSVMKYKI